MTDEKTKQKAIEAAADIYGMPYTYHTTPVHLVIYYLKTRLVRL